MKKFIKSTIKFILSLIFWAIFIKTIILMNDIQYFSKEITRTFYTYQNDDIANLYLKRNHKDKSLYVYKYEEDEYLILNKKNKDVSMLSFENIKINNLENKTTEKLNSIIDSIFLSRDFEKFNLSNGSENNFGYQLRKNIDKKITLDYKYDIDFFNTHLKINHKDNYDLKPNTIISYNIAPPKNLKINYLKEFKRIYDYTYIENYIKHLVKEIHKKGYSFDLYSFEFDYYQIYYTTNFEYDVSTKLSISNLTEDDILSDNFYQILKEKLVIHDAKYIE